ncbi:phosphatidylglycerophosphatase A [Candidatus Dependentiae bacterium]|nr:phosphatidylglycerophosphatase A [Candidatus Dependentiae bacterium]
MFILNDKCKYIFYKLFATVFFIGYTPFCPGAICSFITIMSLYFLPAFTFLYSILILIFLFLTGVWTSNKIAVLNNLKDPSIVVIDELVGMWISVLFIPKIWWLYLLAFLFFRFFDVLKIYPINKLENLNKGWGIMLDDVGAGIISFFLVHIIKKLFI